MSRTSPSLVHTKNQSKGGKSTLYSDMQDFVTIAFKLKVYATRFLIWTILLDTLAEMNESMKWS